MMFGKWGIPFVGDEGMENLFGRAGGVADLCNAGPVGDRVVEMRR